MNTKQIILALIAFVLACILIMYSEMKKLEEQDPRILEKNFNQMLIDNNTQSLYGISFEQRKEWLRQNNDLQCEGELCCGGNIIGWYECF